jgi:inorganic pyrophosphatase
LLFNAVVEVPMGSRNKYEMDHATGRIRLDRELFTATRYPTEYGYIDETLHDDGDPLDVLVLVREPTFPGCTIECRPLGIFLMRDERGLDPKILSIPSWDFRVDWQEISDVPEYTLNEIAHFFDIYKDLEPGKSSEALGWKDRLQAEAEIEGSRRRFVDVRRTRS